MPSNILSDSGGFFLKKWKGGNSEKEKRKIIRLKVVVVAVAGKGSRSREYIQGPDVHTHVDLGSGRPGV